MKIDDLKKYYAEQWLLTEDPLSNNISLKGTYKPFTDEEKELLIKIKEINPVLYRKIMTLY